MLKPPTAIAGPWSRSKSDGAAVGTSSSPEEGTTPTFLRHNGLNLAVFGFTALLLLLLWSALALYLEYDKNTTLQAARANGENLARAYAEHTLGTLRLLDRALQGLKIDIENAPAGADVGALLSRAVEAGGGALLAAVTDTAGNIIASGQTEGVRPPGPGSDFVGDREYFQIHVASDSGRTEISKPVVGRISGRQILVLSRRLNHRDGSFAGVVFVSFDTKYLSGFFADLDIGPHSSFTIVGTDLIIRDMIRGTGPATSYIGQSMANSHLIPALAAAPNGSYEAVAFIDGVHRIFNYRSLPAYDLIVVVSEGYDDILAGYRERRFWLIIAAVVTSALLIVAAALLLRRTNLQHQAEMALRQSEVRFRALIEHSNDILLVVAPDATVLYRSPSAKQAFDIGNEEVVGRCLLDRMHPDDRQDTAAALHALVDDPQRQVHVRSRVRHKDGSWRLIDWSGCNALDVPGVRGLILNSIDITEAEKLQEQLRQVQKLDAIGKLTGGVAHDFNNLLAVIIGNLDLIATELRDRRDLRDMVEAALGASERGATLTRSLLAFSRQQPLTPTTVDVSKLVRELADLVRRTVPENIEIEFVSVAGLWKCEADPGELQNALLNLVVNARDAMPKGGRLTIETGNARLDEDYAAANDDAPPGQYVMLAVSDSGIGMPPDVVAKAFEPFFTTKEVGKGTGLGLSMVYGFAKQSGGHAKIYSEVGQGTTVRIYLPRADKATVDEPLPSIEWTEQSRGEKILVVEDAPDMRALTLKLLHSLGYGSVGVANGDEALEALEKGLRFDLLLTDVVLPGRMNGRLLAEEVQRRHPEIKLLYMSGYTEDAILHHGRLDRGVHLLQKPFTRQNLAVKLRHLLA